jgi:hypothetical protein
MAAELADISISSATISNFSHPIVLATKSLENRAVDSALASGFTLPTSSTSVSRSTLARGLSPSASNSEAELLLALGQPVEFQSLLDVIYDADEHAIFDADNVVDALFAELAADPFTHDRAPLVTL